MTILKRDLGHIKIKDEFSRDTLELNKSNNIKPPYMWIELNDDTINIDRECAELLVSTLTEWLKDQELK